MKTNWRISVKIKFVILLLQITPLLNLPVGKNLQNHVSVPLKFSLNSSTSMDPFDINNKDFAEYELKGSGKDKENEMTRRRDITNKP